MYIFYGGSFNPPTKAHYNIVKKLLKDYDNSKIIICPVGLNYQKDTLRYKQHRYKMLEILFSKHIKENKVILTDYELNQDKYKGTYHTLNYFKNLYKEDIKFVIGYDNFLNLKSWINYEKLIKDFELIIIKRKDKNLDSNLKDIEKKYNIINLNYKSSSTLARKNKFFRFFYLTKDIRRYIKKYKLYT